MKILLHGAAGHMGRILCRLIEENPGIELAAAVDASGADGCLTSLDACTAETDCIVDFSHHSATETLLNYALSRRLPLVLATTGQTEYEHHCIREAGKQLPIFFSANMSPAIAMLADMAAQAVRLFPDADIPVLPLAWPPDWPRPTLLPSLPPPFPAPSSAAGITFPAVSWPGYM